MDATNVIYQKLEKFIKKYYVNELIGGLMLFIGLGLLYFLCILFIEYFLWLKPLGRTILFWIFITVEVYLLGRFICYPLFKLLKFKKGIDYNQASNIIGNHFEEVKDKLLNYIQLAEVSKLAQSSDLLLAFIDQRAADLKPVMFTNAVDFRVNKKYLPVAAFPVVLILLTYITGHNQLISQSLNRVVHFKTEFLPPAPFKFVVLNSKLEVEANSDYVLRMQTIGDFVPENAVIFIDGESYYMEKGEAGEFHYRVVKPINNLVFHVEANGVSSKKFNLKVIAIPTITNLVMQLDFPAFMRRKAEVINGTGNAVVPEGTMVSWKINAVSTQKIELMVANSSSDFRKSGDSFLLSCKISQSTDYQIVSSNNNSKKFEKLKYQLTVVKDQFPTINAQVSPDSLKVDSRYIVGQISDDYGISKLQVVYYDQSKSVVLQRSNIVINSGNFDQFVFSFPGALNAKEGVVYNYYFEVFDNDALHNFKSARSVVFSSRVDTAEETVDIVLSQQTDNIKGLQRSIKSQDKQISYLDKLQKSGKEKESFDFNDQQTVKDFIETQRKQDVLMKNFAEKLKANLDKEKGGKKDEFKEELEKRIEKSFDELDKNKKLLDELKSLNDKIKNEELLDKIDKFKQNSKNSTRNLEQLVELTKKYYVQKKAEQLANKLNQLGDKQEELSQSEKENVPKNQLEINASFDNIKDNLTDLDKENKELKAPVDFGKEGAVEKSIDSDLGKALEELSKDNKTKGKSSQKSASSKMKALSKKMSNSLERSEKDQMEEDVKMLRQVLDNLLAFSLAEEVTMKDVRNSNSSSPSFNKYIMKQQDLRLQFKHIDDSLFAMSLRNPKFTDNITKEVGNAQYNLDKALENLSDSKVAKGLSHQQYVIASANKLGDFLSGILSNMQMELSGAGAGKPKNGGGQEMQLPDIIAKQQGLADKMKKGLDKGKSPGGEKNNDNAGGSLDEADEGDSKDIMDIYKEQKALRDALENELKNKGIGGVGSSTLEQMKQIEKDLLNKGFNKQTLQRTIDVKQELLKLKSALQTQGEDNSRKSEAGVKQFSNQAKALPDALLEYLNSIEILNRQSLPLRSNYNRKVQEYFNKK